MRSVKADLGFQNLMWIFQNLIWIFEKLLRRLRATRGRDLVSTKKNNSPECLKITHKALKMQSTHIDRFNPPLVRRIRKNKGGGKLRVDRFYYKKHCKIFRPLRGRKNKRGVKLKGGVKLRDMG